MPKNLIRIFVSIFFVCLIYARIELTQVFLLLRNVTFRGVSLIILLYFLGQILSVCKWRIFVLAASIDCSLRRQIAAYFFGMFVNTFGLGTLGGDVVRGLALRPAKGKKSAALATVVADRIHGLCVLLIIGAVAVLTFRPAIFQRVPSYLISGSILLLLSSWFFLPIILRKIVSTKHRLFEPLNLAANTFTRSFGKLFGATGISIVFHLIQIYAHFLIAKELKADVTFSYLLATVPFINAASSLPISVNGIGIREAMCVFLLAPAGLSEEVAVTFAALWVLVITVVSIIGGTILLTIFDFSYKSLQAEVQAENTVEDNLLTEDTIINARNER